MPKLVDDSLWVPIQISYPNPQLIGWVNRQYVVPQVAPSVYCADPNLRAIVDEVIEAVRTQNGKRLAKVITPGRGLHLGGYHWEHMLPFSEREVTIFFTDTTYRDWGQSEYGAAIQGSLPDVIVPLLKDNLLGKNESFACNDIQDGTEGIDHFYINSGINALPFYSVLRPNIGSGFDWGAWIFGFDYWQGVPTLSVLAYNFFTP